MPLLLVLVLLHLLGLGLGGLPQAEAGHAVGQILEGFSRFCFQLLQFGSEVVID